MALSLASSWVLKRAGWRADYLGMKMVESLVVMKAGWRALSLAYWKAG